MESACLLRNCLISGLLNNFCSAAIKMLTWLLNASQDLLNAPIASGVVLLNSLWLTFEPHTLSFFEDTFRVTKCSERLTDLKLEFDG